MKISDETTQAMKRIEMMFLNDSTECEFLDTVEELTVADNTIGPFSKGRKEHLPNWVIEKLLNEGLVKIPTDHEPSMQIQKQFRVERQQTMLQNLEGSNPFLYAAVGRRLLNLQSDRTSMDPRRFEEIEKLQGLNQRLVDTRLPKLVRIAMANSLKDKRSQMTHEERWLCEQLADLLSRWREYLVG